MLIAVQSQNRLCKQALPKQVSGAHWVVDERGTRLALVEVLDGKWTVTPCERYVFAGAGGDSRETKVVNPEQLSLLNVRSVEGREWFVVFFPDSESTKKSCVYGFKGDVDITVGRDEDCLIRYGSKFVSSRHAVLSYRQGLWSIVDPGSTNGVYVNGFRIRQNEAVPLQYGDLVSIFALHITVGAGLFSCNNPNGIVEVNSRFFVTFHAPKVGWDNDDVVLPEPQYFYPALRFPRSVEATEFSVDDPPQQEKPDETSLAGRIGPSLLMALASICSAAVFVGMMLDSGSSPVRAVPMVVMAVAMLGGSVLWPILNSRTQNKKRLERESLRKTAYSQYLNKMRNRFKEAEDLQREILQENRITVDECLSLAQKRDVHLMDRTSLHADYLELRIGIGQEALASKVRFPDDRFTMEEDELREAVRVLANEPHVLTDVPVAFSLIEKPVAGVIGPMDETFAFVRGLLVQVAALCSYENVKIMVLCDDADVALWRFAAHLPHCFSNNKKVRFFASGQEESNELGMYIERVLEERRAENQFDAREADPYYVVVCASQSLIERSDLVQAVASDRENRGVSLIAVAREMKDLPKECGYVVGINGATGYELERDDPAARRKEFAPDIAVSVQDANRFAVNIASIRLDLGSEKQKIPSRLGFLEMFDAGSIEHLNVASRWREGNASSSLACRVGVDTLGEPFVLNLHEKAHGPHGLIAGTTGSGKSEFIITYILSMALTYSPDDVAFVLIDYKGGGLAKAFDNEHVHLPHLAGVITNLDGAAITRSLVSLKSELKRRQALFNQARDVVGGDNVDIYDYLNLFRQGKMTEPCPHLFVVADEFAELKQQEPEFMDELISAARIGRSLGVHLILATQKPSGVVNDQIWSNARFKVCLKVADAADSKEMIRRPDAAEISEAGRFYLLVGYNEYFALGQSGYSGTRYTPRERFATTKDDAVMMISNTGSPLISVTPPRPQVMENARPEQVVVLDAIQKTADEIGVSARQLWLEPVPALIQVNNLVKKYRNGAYPASLAINPVIGEMDDPDNQRQGLLTLPLEDFGNAMFYGTSESGVELPLYAMLYSLFSTYDARRVNAYILDFGTESLQAFAEAPHVGGVVTASEEERVRRFLDFIDAENARRKKLLAGFGGSYVRYAKQKDDLPAVVVVINDMGAMLEAYPTMEDRIAKLTRDCGRGGVYLVATAAGTTSVRVRMRQCFRQQLAIDLADESEYGMIFGSMRGIPVPHGYGRGLIRTEEGVYEFQAAHLHDGGDEFGFAARFCAQRADQHRTAGIPNARPIPVAPEYLEVKDVAALRAKADYLPYGLFDDDLSAAGFDFSESALARVQFQKRKVGVEFITAFLQARQRDTGWTYSVLDFAGAFNASKLPKSVYMTSDRDEGKGVLKQLVEHGKLAESDPRVLVIVTGIMDCLNSCVKDYSTGEDLGGDIKAYLKALRPTDGVRFLLVDAASDTSYSYEDWFKAQMSNKDGLWAGPGVDGQSVISTSYNRNLRPDAYMRKSKGYLIEGGESRLVHLVCNPPE